jgi:hypothetical protein
MARHVLGVDARELCSYASREEAEAEIERLAVAEPRWLYGLAVTVPPTPPPKRYVPKRKPRKRKTKPAKRRSRSA